MDNEHLGMPPAESTSNESKEQEKAKEKQAKAEARKAAMKEAKSEISWGLGGFLLAALLLTVFVVQNTENIKVKFLWWDWTLPLAMIIFGVALFAIVFDELAGVFYRRRRRSRAAEKAELERLRKTEK